MKKKNVLYLDTSALRIFYVLLLAFKHRRDLNIIMAIEPILAIELLKSLEISTVIIDVSFFKYHKSLKKIMEEHKDKGFITIKKIPNPLVVYRCETVVESWMEAQKLIPKPQQAPIL